MQHNTWKEEKNERRKRDIWISIYAKQNLKWNVEENNTKMQDEDLAVQ